MKDHATYISNIIREYIHRKYLIGKEAHGGNLERKELLTHAIEEAADLCVYLFTKRDQEAKLAFKLAECLGLATLISGVTPTKASIKLGVKLTEALNMLRVGNSEGIEEEEK